MRISWLIAFAIVVPLLGEAGPELREAAREDAPCVGGSLTTADGSSAARDLDARCGETADAPAEDELPPPSELRPGLLAQRSVTYSPAWAGFGVAKAEGGASFAEVVSEESVDTNASEPRPRETNARRERWKRIGIGVLHVLDFLAELYLEIH